MISLQDICTPQVNLNDFQLSAAITITTASTKTYDNPIKQNVNSAMRIDSVEPLMAGCPAHDAAISSSSSPPATSA
jgi:hypothetical protein